MKLIKKDVNLIRVNELAYGAYLGKNGGLLYYPCIVKAEDDGLTPAM